MKPLKKEALVLPEKLEINNQTTCASRAVLYRLENRFLQRALYKLQAGASQSSRKWSTLYNNFSFYEGSNRRFAET